MSRSSQAYIDYLTPTFDKQLRKLRDGMRIKRIEETIKKILEDPYHNIDFGKGKFLGKRKYDAWKGDRLIFTVCEQCRTLGHQKHNHCPDCQKMGNDAVIFWELVDSHNYNEAARMFG
jgi:mRNA-degrading endonuclease RelE of RelBE toxin-antitoxin system